MINCIIVDDEPLAVQLLQSYAEKIDYITVLKTFSNPIHALSYIQKNQVDLIFLDIQMPEITGIQLARLLPKGSKIIFTTAYSDFALDGFEVNASDYLVKPISFEQFISSTNRITNNFISSASEDKSDSIFVKTEYRLQQVKLQHIQYIKGMGDYSIILTDREKLLTLENMKSLEERLPSKDFIRVHKSYIIPFNKIDFIEKNRIKIKEDLIPIGNTYQDQFWLKIENR